MKKINLLISGMVLSFAIISCSKSGSNTNPQPVACDGTVKSFATDVNPIIQSFCNLAGCHASGSINGPGPLTNFSQVLSARNAIRSAVSSGLMPQNATLSVAQKSAIVCWIDSGAPNN